MQQKKGRSMFPLKTKGKYCSLTWPFLVCVLFVTILNDVGALKLPYEPMNQAYEQQFSRPIPRTFSNIAYDHSNNNKRWLNQDNVEFIRNLRSMCGVREAVSPAQVQRGWKTIWLETRAESGTQSAQIRFVDPVTGFSGDVALSLEGDYNGTLVCDTVHPITSTEYAGCVGLIKRTLAPPGTPPEFIPTEFTGLVFVPSKEGEVKQVCVINSEEDTGFYGSPTIGSNVQHPVVLASLDAATTGVGGTQGPDSGINFNFWQALYGVNATSGALEDSQVLIRTTFYLTDLSALGTRDSVVATIEILIKSSVPSLSL